MGNSTPTLATREESDADAELLRRIAGGERAALATLFEREAGRLIAVAMRIVRRRELAEEIVQEVFIMVWQRAGHFDAARGSARGWITTIVRNRSLNAIRDGARIDFHDASTLAEIGDRRGDAMQAYQRLPDSDALRRCLGQLDDNRRLAILLAYVVGMNHSEAASELNVPLGTVKSWIRRGTMALQECLS